MKRILAVILSASLMFVLTACGTTVCHYEGCTKEVEKSSDSKNPIGRGYLCEEHMLELEEALKFAE